MKDTVTIAELLRGCRIGRMQSAGLMQVIPLLSELEDADFIAPSAAKVGTTGYGRLEFENASDRLMLIPCHAGYVIDAAVQDHAMAHAGMIKGKGKRAFETAMCIQQSQPGLIKSGEHKLLILPFALRETALERRGESQYNKLWGAIQRFNQDFGGPAVGNLVDFLKRFARELDHFVAEFERVEGQVGAIILIDGQVVGFERAPSQEYFAAVWEALIRECYGSQALAAARRKKEDGALPPDSRIPLRSEGISGLDDLEAALDEARRAEEALARSKVRGLLDEAFELELEDEVDGCRVETARNRQFIGQLVRRGERIPYVSLVVSREWRENTCWSRAADFAI